MKEGILTGAHSTYFHVALIIPTNKLGKNSPPLSPGKTPSPLGRFVINLLIKQNMVKYNFFLHFCSDVSKVTRKRKVQ